MQKKAMLTSAVIQSWSIVYYGPTTMLFLSSNMGSEVGIVPISQYFQSGEERKLSKTLT